MFFFFFFFFFISTPKRRRYTTTTMMMMMMISSLLPRGPRSLRHLTHRKSLHRYKRRRASLSLSLLASFASPTETQRQRQQQQQQQHPFFSTQKKGARYAYKVACVFLMSKSEKKERNDDDAQKCVFCLAFFLCEKTQKNSSTILFFI